MMLDEWAQSSSSFPAAAGSPAISLQEEAYGAGGSDLKSFENPICSVDLLERNGSKGHGFITSLCAGNNVILVGTNKGWIVRHEFAEGSCTEVDLNTSRGTLQPIHRVFIDPGGRHSLATILSGSGAETYYIHARWKKPRALAKLKGVVVNAVAWNRQQITDASTREVVIGTTGGQLYETSVDEKDKKEKYLKLLFELNERKEAFVGVQMETVGTGPNTRYFVMAATMTRLYVFVGSGSLEAVFPAYADQAARFTEFPGEIPNSELHFFGKQRRSERFAWLAGPGIYYGHLNLGSRQSDNVNVGDGCVESKWLLNYSNISEGSDLVPKSMALTNYHFLLLYNSTLKVVNSVNQKVIQEEPLDQLQEMSGQGMIGISSDTAAGVFYAYNESSIFEVTVHDEGRDMWQVYLNLKDYASALEHCRDLFQKDEVYAAQAEAAFLEKDYLRAASFYAKTSTIASFEELALKFISVHEPDALRTFLLRRLDRFEKEERSQITMISTWIVELYLDKINRLLFDEEGKKDRKAADEAVDDSPSTEKYETMLKEFRAFLGDCKDVLDEATTVKLLGSYGRINELVYFSSLKEQHETVIRHYIQQRDAKKALAVLRKPNVSPEMLYKFAPELIMLDAYETVESWMTGSNLNVRRLIPALMRYSSEPHSKDQANEAIKFLEYCIQRQHNEDGAVHNLLVSLYAKQDDETSLLRFLESKYGRGRLGRPDVFYDPKYALRLCLEEKRMRACVYIYSMMGMHEEAVALALQLDLDLAKNEVKKIEDDEELKKKLWLMVAKYVVEQEKGVKRENIRKAIAFLSETDGLLKIEDILPFFPDFSLIDDFKEAICASLEDYNRKIEELKREMNDATRGADNIRHDISALSQRYAIVNRDEQCGSCGRQILAKAGLQAGAGPVRTYATLMTPFYVFPCEHVFHAQCLMDLVAKHADRIERDRINDIRKKLGALPLDGLGTNGKPAAIVKDDPTSTKGRSGPVDQIIAQLDDAVAGECPFCGELMIRQISKPFISSEDADEVASWDLGFGSASKSFGLP